MGSEPNGGNFSICFSNKCVLSEKKKKCQGARESFTGSKEAYEKSIMQPLIQKRKEKQIDLNLNKGQEDKTDCSP